MNYITLPPADLLNKLLSYDPGSGALIWKNRTPDMFKAGFHSAETSCMRWNTKHAGKPVRNKTNSGYVRVRIYERSFVGHRIAWKMMTGEDPLHEIDHINGVRDDNRWCNLRPVTHAENMRNTARRKETVTGFTGVHYSHRDNLYEAVINHDGARHRLGWFKDLSRAVAARKAAEKAFGFHENHGRE